MRTPGSPGPSGAAGRGLLQLGGGFAGKTAHGMPNPLGRYPAAFSVTRVLAGIGHAATPAGQPFGPRSGTGAPPTSTTWPPLVRTGGIVVANGMFVTSAVVKIIPFVTFVFSFVNTALRSVVYWARGVIVTPSRMSPESTAPR